MADPAASDWTFFISEPQKQRVGHETFCLEGRKGSEACTIIVVGELIRVAIAQVGVDGKRGLDFVYDVVQDATQQHRPRITVKLGPQVEAYSEYDPLPLLVRLADSPAWEMALFELFGKKTWSTPTKMKKAPGSADFLKLPFSLPRNEPITKPRSFIGLGRYDPEWTNDRDVANPDELYRERYGNHPDLGKVPIDLLRVEDVSLIGGWDTRIRVDESLNGWPERSLDDKGRPVRDVRVRVQPTKLGVSFHVIKNAGTNSEPAVVRVAHRPYRFGDQGFRFQVFCGMDDFSNDRIAIVATPEVRVEHIAGHSMPGYLTIGVKRVARYRDLDTTSIPDPHPPNGKFNTYYESLSTSASLVAFFIPFAKVGFDIGIGMIPVVGDLVDLADFAKAVYTGTDKWGDQVGTLELALMGVAVLPIVSGGMVAGARKGLRVASEGARVAGDVAAAAKTGFLRGAQSYTLAMQRLKYVDGPAYEILMEYRKRFGDFRAVLQKAAGSEGYIDYLDSNITDAARRPGASVEGLNQGAAAKVLDAFFKLAGVMKTIDPPGKAIDDLLSDHTGEFRVWFFQHAYEAHKLKAGDSALTPKAWLRNEAPEHIRIEAKNWLGTDASKIEFGSGVKHAPGSPGAFDEHIESILEEASPGPTGIGRGFDYERFGSAAAVGKQTFPEWQPGLPVDWPSPGGKPPGYTSTLRRKAITNIAYFELLRRFQQLEDATNAGQYVALIKGKSQDEIVAVLKDENIRSQLRNLDEATAAKHGDQPFWQADLTVHELEIAVSKNGGTVTENGVEWSVSQGAGRPNLGGNIQIEHIKPQRGYNAAKTILKGGDDEMILASGVSNPRNMVPVPWLDHMRADYYAARNVGDESLLVVKYYGGKPLATAVSDERVGRRFVGWSNAEITTLVENLRKHGKQPAPDDLPSAENLLSELGREIQQRALDLPIPRLFELGR